MCSAISNRRLSRRNVWSHSSRRGRLSFQKSKVKLSFFFFFLNETDHATSRTANSSARHLRKRDISLSHWHFSFRGAWGKMLLAWPPLVAPDPGVAASENDSALVAISEVAIVAAPIAPNGLCPVRTSTTRLDR